MVTIHVATKCVLNLGDSGLKTFEPGVYEVEDAIADHWYLKTHLYGFSGPAAEPLPGTMAYAELVKKRAADAKAAYDAAIAAVAAAEQAVAATQPVETESVAPATKPRAAKS